MLRIQRSTAVYAVFLLISTLSLTEFALRAYFSQRVGARVMLYGTPWHRNRVGLDKNKPPEVLRMKALKTHQNVREHLNSGSGYTKYFPNERKIDVDPTTREQFTVGINSRGFRGDEIADEKPEGTLRVLTLGASSTFGYYNRDATTYPVFLEEILNRSCEGPQRFEVINLGIPHLTSEEIAALFFAEGAPLDPDVVTFYEGNNDSGIHVNEGWLHAAGKHLLLAALIDQGVNVDVDAPLENLERDASVLSARFLDAVSRIRGAALEDGFLFVIANQQKRSMLVARSEIAGVSYEDELDLVREKFRRTGRLTGKERKFLIHAVMMHDLKNWAIGNQVPFADVIERMDSRRDYLVSQVHLSPEGNRVVATSLAHEILTRVPCHRPTEDVAEHR